MSDAREAILAAIRAAQGGGIARPTIPRDYRLEPVPGVDIVERFAERVADYRAEVRRCAPDAIGSTIAARLASHGARRVVVPEGIEPGWLDAARSRGLELVPDDPPLDHAALDGLDAVVTACAVAIAETGTIVLDAGTGQGRRVLSLLPDLHVCVVRAGQVVDDVPSALARLDARRPLTWISGPSATSDIELDRIEGVHGPRRLEVVLA